MIKSFIDTLFPVACFIAIMILIYQIATAQNEYEAKGELYQCFVEGNQIYASNDRPRHLGGDWYMIDRRKFKADACFCMGCIGL